MWRELALNIESLATSASRDELREARRQIKGLLGVVTLNPKGGILWAYPDPNAKGLAEAKPLHINSQKMVAGARYENYMQIEIEPFPLVA